MKARDSLSSKSLAITGVIGAGLLVVAVLGLGAPGRHSGQALAFAGPDTAAQRDPRAAIFVQRGCSECHAVAALGVKAATDAGPDLTFAYADVVNRYGLNLISFLENPPGLMGFVLASHVHLTQSDRDSIARTLAVVYREHLAEMDENVPSFPPARCPKAGERRPGNR